MSDPMGLHAPRREVLKRAGGMLLLTALYSALWSLPLTLAIGFVGPFRDNTLAAFIASVLVVALYAGGRVAADCEHEEKTGVLVRPDWRADDSAT